MDLPSHKFFQPPSALAPHGEALTESNMSLYGKGKDNPFADAFPDPLCKLNLKETSEFVKSFPMPNAESRGHSVSQQRRTLEAPSTPGRPLFSFSSGLPRKSFPSKWDDAEKWLMSTSCHDSPAHNNNTVKVSDSSKITTRQQCDDGFKHQIMEDFSEKSRVTEERVSKAVSTFHWSSSLDHHHNTLGAFHGAADIVLKDKFTDSIEPVLPNLRYSEPAKEGFLFKNQGGEAMQDACTEVVQHRDVGTEMTPLGSSTTSRCHTPVKISSPPRHNTPASRSGPLALASTACTLDVIQLEECHFSKLQLGTQYDIVTSNWSSSEEEEKEISKSLRHNASHKADSDCIAAAWEEEEKTKCCLRYQREEAKILAWVNLQSAKAEARSRKLEVKIQKMRSNLEEKLMKRMSVVHRKAEEWRAEARQQHLEQIQKATEQAQRMIHKHNSQFSKPSSCGCFPCNNNHH
ncbi:Remorin, C-terminal [Spatholobus suberectus]|nr:Remorin, C-terminal [Spatholobus suberectus]